MAFTKVFADMLTSSVWVGTPRHVKLVWVTLLAKADRHGEVTDSVLGLAKAAEVDVEECKDALACFESPDPHSRNPEHDGRRIERTQRGWRLLNYGNHRERYSREERRAKDAARKARTRADAKRTAADSERTSPQPSAMSAQAEAEAEGEKKTTPGDFGFGTQARHEPEVLELFEYLKQKWNRPGLQLSLGYNTLNADLLQGALDSVGFEQCKLVVDEAPNDAMVSGRADDRGQTHLTVKYVFGNNDAFARILAAATAKQRERTERKTALDDLYAD